MRRVLIAVICLLLAAAPGLVLAKAGDGGSFGSRGSQTFSAPPATRSAPNGALPMQRSLTPNSPSPTPGYAQPQQRPSLFGGFMGGLIGGGLLGLLLGGGMFHGGFGGIFGMILQLALIFFVVRFIARMFFSGGSTSTPPGPGMMPPPGMQQAPPSLHAIPIGPTDYQAYEQILYGVQQAWSQHDIATLRLIATPEMVSYFGEQLAEQTSRGVRNIVSDVHLDAGDLSEAWSEEGRDYATVSMRFSMVDVTYDQAGHVVTGVPGQRVASTEFWTFMRVPGGRWVLSAIQQVR